MEAFANKYSEAHAIGLERVLVDALLRKAARGVRSLGDFSSWAALGFGASGHLPFRCARQPRQWRWASVERGLYSSRAGRSRYSRATGSQEAPPTRRRSRP